MTDYVQSILTILSSFLCIPFMTDYVQSTLTGETGEISRLVKWREAWRFPRHVSKWFKEFVGDHLSLNVCAGASNIGTVRLDLDKTMNPHIQGAMHELPFGNEIFDRVISRLQPV